MARQAERAGADFLGQEEDEDEDWSQEVQGRDGRDCSRRLAGGLRKRLVDGAFLLSSAAPVAKANDVPPPSPLSFWRAGWVSASASSGSSPPILQSIVVVTEDPR